ncbi:hypothetical protein BSZ40_09125 [Buchananella hordeovulneris]|uniref:Uncharacterized protein n=2 Tax=Buchananella hordeovulneris TaxID=52770 RepID=A0A1Q5PU03_9ACTO|nr:hypothetical protein BSZ40_09125 [Buchananella hordeovulneris]
MRLGAQSTAARKVEVAADDIDQQLQNLTNKLAAQEGQIIGCGVDVLASGLQIWLGKVGAVSAALTGYAVGLQQVDTTTTQAEEDAVQKFAALAAEQLGGTP